MVIAVDVYGDGRTFQNLPLGEGVTRSVTDEGYCSYHWKTTLIRLSIKMQVFKHPRRAGACSRRPYGIDTDSG